MSQFITGKLMSKLLNERSNELLNALMSHKLINERTNM